MCNRDELKGTQTYFLLLKHPQWKYTNKDSLNGLHVRTSLIYNFLKVFIKDLTTLMTIH